MAELLAEMDALDEALALLRLDRDSRIVYDDWDESNVVEVF